MTRTPLSRSKVQGHRAALVTAVLTRQAAAVVSVGTYCYVAVCRHGRLGGARRFDAHRGRRGAGAYRGGRPPTACSGVTADTANATVVRFCFVPVNCSGAIPRSDYISQITPSILLPKRIFICIPCFDTVGWAHLACKELGVGLLVMTI